jgi:cytochrome c556
MMESWKSNVITKNLSNPFKAVLLLHKQSFISINVIIMAFMLLFVLSCGKTEKPVSEGEGIVTVLEFESKSSFRLDMKDLEYYCDDLTAAIKKQNWEKIRKHARQLGKMLPVNLTGRKKEELPEDFVTFDSEYHLSIVKLLEAAEAGEMDQLNIEYEKVKQACDKCHEIYKED